MARLSRMVSLVVAVTFNLAAQADEKDLLKPPPITVYRLNADGTKTVLDADKVIVETIAGRETVLELLTKLHNAGLHEIEITLRDAGTKKVLTSYEVGPIEGKMFGQYDTRFPRVVRQGARPGGLFIMWIGDGVLKVDIGSDGYEKQTVTIDKNAAEKHTLEVLLSKEKKKP